MLTVIQSDAGHGDERTPRMGRGGIQTTTEPHFQHQQLDVLAMEMHQS
ncbi:MAG: Uncharacterised protein [Synechococcus sp. CC9902]|nr:MAG: Uncharacterised protein [Synechococcus sp. CC9902]